ncbi:SDR family oxidoreductase [soil metagenome]
MVHLANKHDFEHPEVSNKAERDAVQTIGTALEGSDRPFVLASGVAGFADGRPATEADLSPFHGPDSPRGGAENLALEFVDRGVRTISARFAPTVHGAGDHGFVAALVGVARERGVAAYVGDGSNRWPAVHGSDAVRLVRLGLEQAPAGSVLHVVAEEGVPTRHIAEAIARGLGVPATSVAPEDALTHFGWIGRFFALDITASSTRARELMGWTPDGPTLVEDLDAGPCFRA